MITKWQRNNLTIPVNDGSSNQNDYHYDTKTNGNYLRHRCKKIKIYFIMNSLELSK